MLHAQLRTLLDSIKDGPDDDDRRLLLADWLEDHGSSSADRARGEFVRAQCRLARLPANDPARQELERRAQALADEHADAWTAAWQPLVLKVKENDKGWWFERGLLRLRLRGLRALTEGLLDRNLWAWIDGIDVYGLNPEDKHLFGDPALAHLNYLGLYTGSSIGTYDIGPEVFLALAASPHLCRLTTLDLCLVPVGPEGAMALAASPHLERLTSLGLFAANIGPEGAAALAQSPHLRHLRWLNLSSYDYMPANSIGNEGARALAASAHLGSLSRLELMENDIGDEGARVLAESANLGGLTHLDLKGNFLGPDGARALACSPHLTRLTYLGIGGYCFTNLSVVAEAAEALLTSPHLTMLTCLDLASPNGFVPDATVKEDLQRRFGSRLILESS